MQLILRGLFYSQLSEYQFSSSMVKIKQFIVHYGGFQQMTEKEKISCQMEPHRQEEFPDLQNALSLFNSLGSAAIWDKSEGCNVRVAVKDMVNNEMTYCLDKSYVACHLNIVSRQN